MRAAFRSCVVGIAHLLLVVSQVHAAAAYDPKTAPKPIELIPPEYPAIARRFNVQGAVTIALFGIRPVVEAPILKDELGQGAVNSWGEVHLIITNGESTDSHHITRISDPGFRQTLEGVINRLRFAAENPNGKPWSVNIFKIQVDDLSITIDQRPGE